MQRISLLPPLSNKSNETETDMIAVRGGETIETMMLYRVVCKRTINVHVLIVSIYMYLQHTATHYNTMQHTARGQSIYMY